MSFKYKVKIEFTLTQDVLADELGKDHTFEQGEAQLREVFTEITETDGVTLDSLVIEKIETSVGALYPVGVG